MGDPRLEISFPDCELVDLKRRLEEIGWITTTRVDDEFGRYCLDQVLDSNLGCRLKVIGIGRIHDVLHHPYRDELTHDQLELLSRYTAMDIVVLKKY